MKNENISLELKSICNSRILHPCELCALIMTGPPVQNSEKKLGTFFVDLHTLDLPKDTAFARPE